MPGLLLTGIRKPHRDSSAEIDRDLWGFCCIEKCVLYNKTVHIRYLQKAQNYVYCTCSLSTVYVRIILKVNFFL